MGNCLGRSTAAKRQDNWRATGMVSMRDAGLKALPAAALDISSDVRVLDVTNNRLTQLPAAQLGWPQLQRLVLSGNALAELPATIAASMPALRHLALDNNRITALPPAMGQLARLEVLLLQGNSLLALPPSLGQLSGLKTLNVAGNQLGALPEELGRCSALQELDAASNQLAALPAGLAALRKLKVLQLDGNRIAALPPGLLAGCSSLHTLGLRDNPITPQQLAEAPGWADFDGRRRSKYDKVIAGNALLGSAGLDEGVDRLLKEKQ